MSIYGEPSNQFRERPSLGVLFAFSLFSTMIGATLGPLFYSVCRTLVTRSLRTDYIFNIHAPIAANPSLGLFPLHSDVIVIGSVVAAGSIAIVTALFVAVYPASQKLANRLALYGVGTAVVSLGAAATLADLGLLRALARWKQVSELAGGGALAGAVFGVLLVVVWFERCTISVLGNLFPVDNPAHRFLLWTIRIPIPWLAFAGAAYLADWWGGVIASGGVIVATLVDDLAHWPSLRYETLERPKMLEGLAAAAMVTLILVVSSTWLFGLPAAQRAPRALVVDQGSATIVPVSELTNRIQEDTMPRIDMKWSSDK